MEKAGAPTISTRVEKRRILLIDDSEITLQMEKAVLEERGYDVRGAATLMEFERLLAEVSKDDRDSMLAKTYLTSETGKVYTMLAHASGRFD